MGKEQFDAIPVPAELSGAVKRGLRKGRLRLACRRTLSGMAAALALVFLTANIPCAYVQALELPLLAPLVRVMRIGNGGEAVSGASAQVHVEENRVRLTFTYGREAAPVPVFSAVQRQAPRRVILRLHGLAQDAPLGLAEALLDQTAVSDAYAISVTDPAEQGVVFHLEPGWNCAVGQSENSLELQFSQGTPEPRTECYVLQSAPLPQGKALAELTEALLWEGATQLRAPSGEYYVVLGEFASAQQAEQARKVLLETHGTELRAVHLIDGLPQS